MELANQISVFHRLRWFLFFLGGGALLFSGSAWVAYSYINSERGSQFLLAQVKKKLHQRTSVEFEYQEGTLKPFGRIHFEGLKIVQRTETGQIEIRIKSIDIQYTIHFWARKVAIQRFFVDHPTVLLRPLSSPSSPLAKPTSASQPGAEASSSGSNQSDVSRLFRSPLVKFTIQKFSMLGLSMDLDLKTPEGNLKAKLRDASLDFSLELDPIQLLSELEFSLKDLTLAQSVGNRVTRLVLPELKLESKIDLLTQGQDLFHLDRISLVSLASSQVLTTNAITLEQSEGKNVIRTHLESQKASLTLDTAQEIQGRFDYVLNQLALPSQLTQPVNIHIQSMGTMDRNLAQMKIQGSSFLNEISLLDFDLLATQVARNGGFQFQGKVGANLDHRLSKWVKPLVQLENSGSVRANIGVQGALSQAGGELKFKVDTHTQNKYGKWLVHTDLDSTVALPKNPGGNLMDGLKADLMKDSVVKTKGSTTIRQESLRSSGSPAASRLVTLAEPVVIKHQIDLNDGQVELDLETIIPKLQVRGFPALSGFKTRARAVLQDNNRFSLEELTAELNHSVIRLSAEASGDFAAKNFQSQGTLSVEIPAEFPNIESQKLQGQIEFPWNMAIYHGQNINLEGVLNFQNMSWSKLPSKNSESSFQLLGISGKIPVSEQLLWNGKLMQFSHLISQNPFERVDFERLQPMIHESGSFLIEKLGFEEKVYGPFQGFFSIRQNMIFAHKFDITLGDGRSNGELYFDAYPKNLQMGILARLTGLNLSEILPRKYLLSTPNRNEKLSGRSGLVLNFNSASIDGRIDLTEIGRSQMITLINMMDPRYENEKMNQARFGLSLAAPSFIQMSFQQGYMDMGFQLSSPIRQEFMIRGIPVSSWLSSAKDDINERNRKIE